MLLTYGKQRSPATNSGLAKKRVQCLNEALCFVSSSVLADSFVLRNPLLRQAPKRLYAEIDTIFYPNDKEIIVAINSFEKNPMTNYKYDCHGCSPYLNLIKLSNENNKLELIASSFKTSLYKSQFLFLNIDKNIPPKKSNETSGDIKSKNLISPSKLKLENFFKFFGRLIVSNGFL